MRSHHRFLTPWFTFLVLLFCLAVTVSADSPSDSLVGRRVRVTVPTFSDKVIDGRVVSPGPVWGR